MLHFCWLFGIHTTECYTNSEFNLLPFILIDIRKCFVSVRKRVEFSSPSIYVSHFSTHSLCISKRVLCQSQQVIRLTALPSKRQYKQSLAWLPPSVHSLSVFSSPAPEKISLMQIQNTIIQINQMGRVKWECSCLDIFFKASMLLLRIRSCFITTKGS